MLTDTVWVILDKQKENHCNEVLWMPKTYSTRSSRTWWYSMSNAAERSRKALRTEMLLSTTQSKRSLTISRSVGSLTGLNLLFEERWSESSVERWLFFCDRGQEERCYPLLLLYLVVPVQRRHVVLHQYLGHLRKEPARFDLAARAAELCHQKDSHLMFQQLISAKNSAKRSIITLRFRLWLLRQQSCRT